MTMNKLIEVAEELYKQIDKAQVHLINARLNNNEEGKESAISEIETAMCNAMQLLKCFIDRKDNIVDLSKVFHNVVEKPDRGKDILIDTDTFGYDVVTAKWHSDERCDNSRIFLLHNSRNLQSKDQFPLRLQTQLRHT